MARKTHVWIEDPFHQDATITAAAVIEGVGELTSYTSQPVPQSKAQPGCRSNLADRARIWYSFPEKYGFALTKGADPFVLTVLFSAMRRHMDIHVHGEVSPSLLRNLDEFQSAWASWRPEQYSKIEITADSETEQERAASNSAVSAFSGGVDSAFTAYRHSKNLCGRSTRPLKAGVMVQGFDILLDKRQIFESAAKKSKRMLSSLGMDMIPVVTNLRDLRDQWSDSQGTALVSCLMLFQGGFSEGLVPSSEPYNDFVLPWCTNPVTDWMLSSDSFRTVYDGASFSRTEKVRQIAGWQEALQDLRVCLVGEGKDENCGICEKCIRTILDFRVHGLPLPGCFDHDVSGLQIMKLTELDAPEFRRILALAKKTSINDPWVKALKLSLFKYGLRKGVQNTSRRLKSHLRRSAVKIISGFGLKPASAADL